MAKLALAFDILARDAGASKTFKKVGDSAERAGGQIDQTAKRSKRSGALIAGGLSGIATAAGGAVVGLGLAAAGLKKLTDPAADAEQSIGGVQSVFKAYAKTVIDSSKAADRALGLSANSYRELATVIGSQLKNAGVPLEDLGKQTNALITQGADLAAMFGGTTAEAVAALSSALKGEMDPIERYGISLNEAALKAKALELGLYSGTGALDQNTKAMAVMALVAQQGADAAGAFGREQDTAAGRAQRAAAQWENLKVAIGDRLLPAWSGLMDFVGTTVLPGLSDFNDFLGDEVNPKVKQFASLFTDDVDPAMKGTHDFLRDSLTPVLREYSAQLDGNVNPANARLTKSLDANSTSIAELALGAARLRVEVESRLWTVFIQFAGWLSATFLRTVDEVNKSVKSTRDLWRDTKQNAQEFMDALQGFKLPGWMQSISDTVGRIGGAFSSARASVIPGMGDGPGRFSGGNTLNRVKGLLPAGAAITSTYRTPAQNAAVGGVVGSYHTDRSNPAVDVAGSRSAMDAFYAAAARVGGWRELLYKTAGHWDHVHVAHNGGTVSASWPQMPGWRSDERPVRARIGEEILTESQSASRGATRNYDVKVYNTGPNISGHALYVAQRHAELLSGDWGES